jgi:hypothetical protein
VYTRFFFFGFVGLCVPGFVFCCLAGGRFPLELGFLLLEALGDELVFFPFTDFADPFELLGGFGAMEATGSCSEMRRIL